MRRNICIMACLAAVLLAPAGWAADRLVPTGYSTIQAAVNAAVAGDRIVISGTHVENGVITIALNDLTITSGAPRADIRESRWSVLAQNITFQSIDINGNSVAGAQSTTAVDLVTLFPNSGNITFEDCKIVNPAAGTNTGEDAFTNEVTHSNPGCAIDVRTPGALTIRNCNFVNQHFLGGQNIGGLHFNQASNAVGPVLVENCAFSVQRRCIDFQSGWSNVTVRNCTFHGEAGAFNAACGVFINTDDVLPVGVSNNFLIENCQFLGNGVNTQAWAGMHVYAGEIHGMTVRGCSFPVGVGGDDIYWRMRGDNLLIEDCNFDGITGITLRMTVRVDTGNLSGIGDGDPALTFRDCVIRNNTFTNIVGQTISCGEGFISGYLMFGNYFADMPASYAFGALDLPFSGFIRDNEMVRCGASGILGGISTVYNDGVISDNFILDCRVGIALRTSRGLYAGVNPQLDRNTRNVTLARNVIIGSASDGFYDASVDGGETSAGSGIFWNGRPNNIRYFNNTVVNAGNDCMAVRGDSLQVYNNILYGGIASVRDLAPASHKSAFTALGFNLSYNNSYFGFTFPGGAPRPSTDVRITAPTIFITPFPTTRAQVTPLPGSAPIDAGSADGVNPDFRTDIGAIETGAVIDTAVSNSAWELYR